MRTALFLLIVFLVAFPSCEGDEGPVGPTGPEGPPGSGAGYTNDPSLGYSWGGTWTDAANVTFDVTEEQSTVFFLATVNVWGPGSACKSAVRLSFDGTADDKTMIMVDIPTATGGNNGASVATSAMKVFAQGSHTVTLQRSGCAFSVHPHINVIVLGN